MIHEEMIRATDFAGSKVWRVTVGDLEPHEIGAGFIPRMAPGPEAFRILEPRFYLSQRAARIIGPVPLRFTTGGLKYIRFTVTGRNPSSSNAWILLDSLTFRPESPAGEGPARD